ncbi:outer membrane protein assembly factor BamE domain-containing protein [Pseudomonas knackmussii]|nr:outer membrane protein assembly factor BamE [Pseudomonas knackmussii]
MCNPHPRWIALALTIGTALECQAATLYRCESADGHLTFSQHGCPPDQLQNLQEAFNPTPGSGKPVPLARPKAPRATKRTTAEERPALTIVGERQDGCGNLLDESERRTAIIQGRIRTGMTRADVENALGKPDRVAQTDSRTRYIYHARPGKAQRSVTFDEFGCVKGSAKKKR